MTSAHLKETGRIILSADTPIDAGDWIEWDDDAFTRVSPGSLLTHKRVGDLPPIIPLMKEPRPARVYRDDSFTKATISGGLSQGQTPETK